MITLEQYSDNVKKCILELQKEVPLFIWDGTAQGKNFGNDIVAGVKSRITTEGRGAYAKFNDYTPKYQAFKSGETRIRASKKPLKSGKLSKGTKHGNKYQGFRDLTYTGDLMLAFKPYKEGNQYGIGFKEDEAQKIAEGNSTWAGVEDVIEPSLSEIQTEVEIFEERIMEILKKYLTP